MLLLYISIIEYSSNLGVAVKGCEIFSCTSLKWKLLSQGTFVPFRHNPHFALFTTKFLGE